MSVLKFLKDKTYLPSCGDLEDWFLLFRLSSENCWAAAVVIGDIGLYMFTGLFGNYVAI